MVKKTENGSSKRMMNKGAWTAEEDQKLAEYVKIQGDKKWRSLPAKAGLNRCGKSCRLRWLNYLRPGIKRGNISEDEEDLIIRLHNLIGNRWSLIAGRLPGRTDNEIKNHWNTHLSKKSLTINELNNKLNQKLETSPSARPGEGPLGNQVLDPIYKSNGSDGAQMASKIWNGSPEKDFDIGDLFDLSSVTGMVGLPESNHQGTGGIGLQDHDFGGQEIYQNLLTTELQGSYGGYFDQPLAYDQLEFDALTRLLEYGNDAFFSFF